jgi:hypothetical protein
MFVNQKAQEISYALIRVAAYVRRQELKQRIERLAFQLLEEAASGNFEAASKAVSGLEGLIGLGKAIYEIEPLNAKIIIGELSSLNAAIRQITGTDELPHLEEVFSKPPAIIEERIERQEIGNSANGESSNGLSSAIRQSAILEKIRQSENRQIQLKELLAAFPEVSERTMRYDLQKLCTQGLLERVGNGGPGSYYVIK